MDLSHIYNLRSDFTIIGLTGQIGSGCSEVAEQLSRGFNFRDFEDPIGVGIDPQTRMFKHNSYRKYRIVYNYAKYENNFRGYSKISYKDVLVIFLLQYSIGDFINFLKSAELKRELETILPNADFDYEIEKLMELKPEFEVLEEKYGSIEVENIKNRNNWEELYEFYFNPGFVSFCGSVFTILKERSRVKRNKLLQIISTNLRKCGEPYEFSEPSANNIFTMG